MMDKKKIIEFIREKIHPEFWEKFCVLAPATAIFLLPIGLLSTYILGLVGFEGVGRLNQLLILFSIFYGILAGIFFILFAEDLELSLRITNKIKWLSRFAVVTPLLTVLVLFLIFSR